MIHLKYFESIRDEYPDMFAPRKPEDEPQEVPGFENGTIDPNDDDIYYDDFKKNRKSDKERYKDFLKLTRERNFKETDNEIIINLKQLYQDFYMVIYGCREHFRIFLRNEIEGKYITKGFEDIVTEKEYEGIIKHVHILYDDYSAFINFTLQEYDYNENTFCKDFITIDKIKTDANKYNL